MRYLVARLEFLIFLKVMIVVSDIVALHGVSLQPASLEYPDRGR